MPVSLQPHGSDLPSSGYITWTPVPLVVASPAGETSGALRLSCRSAPGSVARVVFLEARDQPPKSEIQIDLQAGQERTIFIAGEFQPGARHNGASVEGKDVTIEARWVNDPGIPPASVDVMIRVRRNANELSDQARKDFLFALAKLNGILVDSDPTPGPGFGIYVADFVAMHVDGATASEHGDSHFLPWHRLYLLDLERLLQAIKPTVTLPYWRFDQAAPNLFTEDFMGAVDQIPRDTRDPGGESDSGFDTPLARFAVGNPLSRWQIGDVQGIPRAARFNPQTGPANGMIFVRPTGAVVDFAVLDEKETLKLGGDSQNPQAVKLGQPGEPLSFRQMEGTPHGAAHVSFNGPINSVPIAPRDPLFFLLHSNVDRLWALWQHLFERNDRTDKRTYPYQQTGDADPWEIISARQWPWDGGKSKPGNLLPPGTRKENFTKSDLAVSFPSDSPILADAIDPFANRDQGHYLGFGYDDVPYDHAEQNIA